MTVSEKVLSPESVPAWRGQLGRSTPLAVVTGSFDLVQPGNLYAIRRARDCAGAVLVVVEPDELAARHAGAGCPQNHVETRVEMVAHLRDVARVTSASEDQMKALLASLAPFTWVTPRSPGEEDPYGAVLEEAASQVERIPLLKGCRSREIIHAIEHHQTPIPLPPEWRTGLGPSPSVPGRRGVTVTVNGCFDILHVGHLRFLEEARAMGDFLTVLINSDQSVARYKGPTRPVFPELFRVAALKALGAVDDVVVFGKDNPLDEIQQLRPRIHVKGGSYEPDRVRQERELVESWGGRLVCTPMVEGFSTTHYIKKALQGLRQDMI